MCAHPGYELSIVCLQPKESLVTFLSCLRPQKSRVYITTLTIRCSLFFSEEFALYDHTPESISDQTFHIIIILSLSLSKNHFVFFLFPLNFPTRRTSYVFQPVELRIYNQTSLCHSLIYPHQIKSLFYICTLQGSLLCPLLSRCSSL